MAPLPRRRRGRPRRSSAPAPAAGCSPSGWRGAGWRIVVLESGPFWDPDRDWVSDEAGQHKLYWTAPRVIGGEDPVELGKNNSGHGVGGSMIHYAGYAPRFHPSDFETRTRDGVGADWPIALRGAQAPLRARRARAAGRRPGLAVGRPAPLPARPAPDLRRGRAARARRAGGRHRDARRAGRDPQRHVRQPPALHLPRLLPAGLQGQREGLARWSPTCRTRIAHGVEVRADAHAVRVEVDADGRCTGVTYTARRARALPARGRRRRVAATRSRRRGCC